MFITFFTFLTYIKVSYTFITFITLLVCSRYSPERARNFTTPKTLNYTLKMENNDTKKTDKYEKPQSTFTLLVYFKNGYTQGMKFHSWKQEKRKFAGVELTDHRYALNRLVHLVEEVYKGKYKTAIIYHNPTQSQIMQWAYDSLKHKELGKWTYATNGDVLFNTREASEKELAEIQDRKMLADKEMNYRV